MDGLFTFLLVVSANVLSGLIIDWLKDLRKNKDDEENKNNKR